MMVRNKRKIKQMYSYCSIFSLTLVNSLLMSTLLEIISIVQTGIFNKPVKTLKVYSYPPANYQIEIDCMTVFLAEVMT